LHDEELIEHDFDLVDLDVANDLSTLQKVIKEKYSQIMELQDNLERAKFIISFLEQENNQLTVKQLMMEKEKFKMMRKEVKGKVVLEHDEHDEQEK